MRNGLMMVLISCLYVMQAAAQPMSMVGAKTTVPNYKPGGPGAINCFVQWSLIKNGKNMKIFFYAQNDVRNIPMQLVYKGKNVPIKVKPSDEKYFYTVFTPALKDIFFKDKSLAGYTWKWQGTAKAPASPLAEVNGQKPRTIKYWFTVKVEGAQFSTEPNYIDIK
jgi:hypothetical protein